MSAETTIGSTTYDLGPWVPSGRLDSPPPHYLGRDPRHPNELGVVWADDRHRVPLAVEDYDGCRAAILPATALSTADQSENPRSAE